MSEHDKEREAIIERLRKLSKLTVENGCTESEALNAATRLAALMREHNVKATELSVRADAQRCIMDMFLDLGANGHEYANVTASISRLFQTRCWRSRATEDVLEMGFMQEVNYIKYYGTEADVVASMSLLTICYTAIATELEHAKIKRVRSRSSFRMGMASRLAERIDAMRVTGTQLIVLKNQLVNDEFARYCADTGLRLSKGRHTAASDVAAFRAGEAAANRVNLGGKSIGGGPRLIGKA
jgi:hypothetical protein